ncbi:MAG TPA: EhaG family protein [Candidatus Methanoculleus thermohydrogenotrophicum]|jgi:energy-converting hydrogenase A subunit G|nr:EhaG family protein [Candidatus Methanoculleus thermohydrogenotrophicum]NLM82770.1 EhaG family protein [Candidatus Methanoculleus thermohydrogenotrophicum]HOB18031.1 EhaG family protein [Candidatus Methanoculleus thermohydrogenotrophicum]HPZ38143.1 EhaG family protein [Candidatus Methanoculleus thermohydrogenotrophicum]HQC91015.1 EhaG family protein [Candidatus Methanoculleus thermohydrogenotrophicum]
MDITYPVGLLVVAIALIIGFTAIVLERDDLHRILLTDLAEILALVLIALVATDLAEALILPGLVVGISELMAVSEVYITREGLRAPPAEPAFHIEVMDSAPGILALILVGYGIILSGFTGGVVAAVGTVFYFMCRGHDERFELIETVSGYAWAIWIGAFFIFMFLPQYWFFAVMMAGGAILLKVMAKMSLVGTMRGGPDV